MFFFFFLYWNYLSYKSSLHVVIYMFLPADCRPKTALAKHMFFPIIWSAGGLGYVGVGWGVMLLCWRFVLTSTHVWCYAAWRLLLTSIYTDLFLYCRMWQWRYFLCHKGNCQDAAVAKLKTNTTKHLKYQLKFMSKFAFRCSTYSETHIKKKKKTSFWHIFETWEWQFRYGETQVDRKKTQKQQRGFRSSGMFMLSDLWAAHEKSQKWYFTYCNVLHTWNTHWMSNLHTCVMPNWVERRTIAACWATYIRAKRAQRTELVFGHKMLESLQQGLPSRCSVKLFWRHVVYVLSQTWLFRCRATRVSQKSWLWKKGLSADFLFICFICAVLFCIEVWSNAKTHGTPGQTAAVNRY